MKYQQVADVVVELYTCATCVKGFKGLERHYNPSLFKKCLQKNRFHEKFEFFNF